jgi:antitoxin component YwqK of YwqJK toxin-antitoxin module
MKKIIFTVLTLFVLCGMVYGQAAPKDGVQQEFYDTGELKAEITYKNGVLNGDKKKFYPNGQEMLVTTYKDGKIVGVSKTFYEDGKLQSETPYKDGQKDGERKEYYQNGKVQTILTYKGRRVVNKKTFDEKGKRKTDEDIDEAAE